ncbi:uncharacterized protein LOC107199175 [Parus major]|uniref:uncharacterized protein LOC107199175 n=1 Tax=Parus major TaxID=9157 RepID=UPI000771327B|nr:uncharacterized protein LOC107199175 [Parus major]XP_015472001.1 uncharacterized protein LOC107199175 [Parus major]XP_018861041.1 uncharacterized protein LOC107199175 [Parus major]XP_033367585.1 uncharacterized protein LOC107199175 [Parus major]XP_033367586.1 uncharacterized protein LOC107199175 [Parus major]
MQSLSRVISQLHMQWRIDFKSKDFECMVVRLLELCVIDDPVDILRPDCWVRCTKVLTDDVLCFKSSKCLKSWARVTQALRKALQEQETWKAAQSCFKVTPRVGVGAATQTTFIDCPTDSNWPSNDDGRPKLPSRLPGSNAGLAAEHTLPPGGTNTTEPRGAPDTAGPGDVRERPPPYTPRNGTRERSEVFRAKMAAGESKSVLFVCLGNICRSPIAEAVFRKLVTDEKLEHKWRTDSAATSAYEIGSPPDYRGQNCMKKHGITMNHIARQITKEDFQTFDHILCMDESNLRDLNRKSNQVKDCKAKIQLLGTYDPRKPLIVEDLKVPGSIPSFNRATAKT